MSERTTGDDMRRFREARERIAASRQAARDRAWHDPDGYAADYLAALRERDRLDPSGGD